MQAVQVLLEADFRLPGKALGIRVDSSQKALELHKGLAVGRAKRLGRLGPLRCGFHLKIHLRIVLTIPQVSRENLTWPAVAAGGYAALADEAIRRNFCLNWGHGNVK